MARYPRRPPGPSSNSCFIAPITSSTLMVVSEYLTLNALSLLSNTESFKGFPRKPFLVSTNSPRDDTPKGFTNDETFSGFSYGLVKVFVHDHVRFLCETLWFSSETPYCLFIPLGCYVFPLTSDLKKFYQKFKKHFYRYRECPKRKSHFFRTLYFRTFYTIPWSRFLFAFFNIWSLKTPQKLALGEKNKLYLECNYILDDLVSYILYFHNKYFVLLLQ